ncbi:DNA-binding GntR family transcriptional regulator [Bradyrhizobium sp. USDA 4011]
MTMTLASSLTQSVYQDLRTKLLNGDLRPGEKLKISTLCETLSVNLSAVREALARLTSEGLVIAEPQRGFRVAPISVDDLVQLTDARVHIETLCLARSIENGDLNWETSIVASLHRLLHTPRFDASGKNLSPNWASAHSLFHTSLVAACDNVWLLRMREMLTTQSDRYRWLSAATSGKKRDLDKEHSKIADAVIAKDPVLSAKLMSTHMRLTTEILIQGGLVKRGKAASSAG